MFSDHLIRILAKGAAASQPKEACYAFIRIRLRCDHRPVDPRGPASRAGYASGRRRDAQQRRVHRTHPTNPLGRHVSSMVAA